MHLKQPKITRNENNWSLTPIVLHSIEGLGVAVWKELILIAGSTWFCITNDVPFFGRDFERMRADLAVKLNIGIWLSFVMPMLQRAPVNMSGTAPQDDWEQLGCSDCLTSCFLRGMVMQPVLIVAFVYDE